MKLILALLLISANAFATAEPAVAPAAKSLMKCFGKKNGTLWASFGRRVRDGKTTHFPTEVAVFNNFFDARLFYKTFEESFAADFRLTEGFIHYGFKLERDGHTQEHTLSLLVPDPRDPNSFQGNWTMKTDAYEYMDEVYCTVL